MSSPDTPVTQRTSPLDTTADGTHTAVVALSPSSPPRARGSRKAYGRGRPPKALTEERLEIILEQVALGVPPQTAAVATGVPEKTWKNWLARGREVDPVEPYASVVRRVDAAIAVYHQSRVSVIHAGAEKDPRLAQWELERRFSDEWGDKSRSGVTINLGVILQSPEWITLSERLLTILEPFPDALAAVAAEIDRGVVVDGEATELPDLTSDLPR